MRHDPIDPSLFVTNRARLKGKLLPNSLAVVNSNDIPVTNADGSRLLIPSSDLFYLTGVEQEESLLLLYPDADEEKFREILFLRKPTPEMETWEGHKLTREEARALTGVQEIHWLGDFPRLFHRLMCECEHVYLNTNEHKRAVIEAESREARFVADTLRRYPLHNYHRLARVMHDLRVVKSAAETALVRRACEITGQGFRRALGFVQPGVSEMEVEVR